MKKSLIALAVLAASGAAMAQSSVSVYGIVDLVVHKDAGVSAKMTSGGVSGSRLGFKGTEDLGAGLKANFLLEEGFDATSGAAGKAGYTFNRQAYVGLSGNFGEVKLGNVFTAYDDISGATNPVFDSVLSPTTVWASSAYNSNPGSNLYYATPKFRGLSGAVSYSVVSKQKVQSFNVTYEGGPIYVGFGYQDDTERAGDKFTRVNGSYDLGKAKLLAGYGKVKNADVTEYTIGADVPLAANLVLSTGYAASTDAADVRTTGFSVGAAYSLSKRTTVYGGYLKTKNGGVDSRVGAGIKHTF